MFWVTPETVAFVEAILKTKRQWKLCNEWKQIQLAVHYLHCYYSDAINVQ